MFSFKRKIKENTFLKCVLKSIVGANLKNKYTHLISNDKQNTRMLFTKIHLQNSWMLSFEKT